MKTFWVIVIILIIIGGFWWVKKNKAEAPVVETPSEEVATSTDGIPEGAMMEDGTVETMADVVIVTYSSQGFSPETVEVEVGQIVRFVNESNNKMWVASNDHPTHEIYSAFDQKVSVNKGSSYEFAFDKAGSWKYHNHSRATDGGTVVVK